MTTAERKGGNNMVKSKKRGYAILAIIFVVYSVIVFAAPFPMTAVFWIAYLFGVVAIAAQLYLFGVLFEKGTGAKSKFYGFPIVKIGAIYLIVQIVLSLVQMIMAKVMPAWIAVIIDVLVAAVVAVGCIAADVMRDEIERQDVQLKKDVTNMRDLQSLTASLSGLCKSDNAKKMMRQLANDFSDSDPVSSDATLEHEQELKFMVNEIQKALIDGDEKSAMNFCERVGNVLVERNRVCKRSK